jgi:hypothetical protein
MDHFLRTGFDMFTAVGEDGYVAEKAETSKGWLFPVGDEVGALGYDNMFHDMFECLDNDEKPMEDFYDGYVVNAIIDACYLSVKTKKWEPVNLEIWRGKEGVNKISALKEYDDRHYLIKQERLPNGTVKLILKEKASGKIIQKEI